MKYIKLFEGFLPNDVIQDIEDIFLELKDQGFRIRFQQQGREFKIAIDWPKGKKDWSTDWVGFAFSEISEEILRLHDFLKPYGYNFIFNLVGITNIPKSIHQLFKILEPVKDKKMLFQFEITITPKTKYQRNITEKFKGIFTDTWDRDDIDRICAKYNIQNYTINNNGSIDVDGNVDLSQMKLKRIPIRFRNVSGHFWCFTNYLTDLQNSPINVGGGFYCHNNLLQNLIDSPESVGYDYACNGNRITSLSGCPETINGNFFCNHNQLRNLRGGPRFVELDYNAAHNRVDSFEGFPKSARQIYLHQNPINNIYKLFYEVDKIELFNDYDILQDNEVILDRLNDFLREVKKPTVKKVEGYNNI